jgi:hypothetical protein
MKALSSRGGYAWTMADLDAIRSRFFTLGYDISYQEAINFWAWYSNKRWGAGWVSVGAHVQHVKYLDIDSAVYANVLIRDDEA